MPICVEIYVKTVNRMMSKMHCEYLLRIQNSGVDDLWHMFFFSGHKSIGESLMKSFGLSQEEVMRLMSNKSVRKSTILKKLKLLTEYGFRKDQITARIIRYNAKGIQYFFRK